MSAWDKVRSFAEAVRCHDHYVILSGLTYGDMRDLMASRRTLQRLLHTIRAWMDNDDSDADAIIEAAGTWIEDGCPGLRLSEDPPREDGCTVVEVLAKFADRNAMAAAMLRSVSDGVISHGDVVSALLRENTRIMTHNELLTVNRIPAMMITMPCKKCGGE